MAMRYRSSMFITCANTKGGVGKSTIAVHLAVWLTDHGAKTALIDADKQRSSSQWMAEADPNVTIRVADTPEEALSQATELSRSHVFVVADAAGGVDDLARSLLLLADLALLPITPSILDLRSLQQAVGILKFAQGINRGRPEGRLILNKMRSRDRISRELQAAADSLGVRVADGVVRDLQAFRDAAQSGTVVTRMQKTGNEARRDMERLFKGLIGSDVLQQAIMNNSSRNEEAANG